MNPENSKNNQLELLPAAPSVEPLTTEDYWNKNWRRAANPVSSRPALERLKLRVKRMMGESMVDYFRRNYADYVVWEKLYREHLPPMQRVRVLEIGGAPGHFLVHLNREFGCIPFAVEYASDGVELTRQAFRKNGSDPDNVIFADAFSDDFQNRFCGFFDVVFSRGVIEHFSDVKPVVEKHLALLKPGGSLVVSIPNYRGCNYLFKRALAPKSLRAHNLELMRKREFRKAFAFPDLRPVFCDYYGTCDLSMFIPEEPSRFRVTFQILDKAQVLLNGIFRLTLHGALLDSALLSPFLLFIGIRAAGPESAQSA